MSKRCRSNTLISQQDNRMPILAIGGGLVGVGSGGQARDTSMLPLSLNSNDDIDLVQSINQIDEEDQSPME